MGILPLNRQLGKFRFKRNSSIGAADAIDDNKYLSQSFIDTGDLSILRDSSDPKCIVLGRTGAGKTALLQKLHEEEERTIKLDPDNLALTYIANNGILKFFADLGVNLDIFYRLLWRHTITVELIKAQYQIVDEKSNANFWQDVLARLSGNAAKQSALNYLRSWGEKFWMETDYRVSEITQKVERDLNLSAKNALQGIIPGSTANLELNAGIAKRLTEEQKAELVHKGQKVVNQVQIADLAKVIEVLD